MLWLGLTTENLLRPMYSLTMYIFHHRLLVLSLRAEGPGPCGLGS